MIARLLLPAVVGGLLAAGHADAEEPRWQPGQRTTSRLPGEVGERSHDSGDGVYGRFSGDLDVGFGLGAELGDGSARAAGRLSLHYFSMVGVTVGFAEDVAGDDPPFARALSLGVDVRPAFIPRWSEGLEDGPGFVDLAIDSISLGLGAYWAAPPVGALGDERGFELSGGLGFPLLARANGLWLEGRAVLRWPEPPRDRDGPRTAALLLLSWHGFVSSPLTRGAD
jgi:hypothetical protein